MPSTYSFEVIAPADGVDALLTALSAHLAARDRQRVQSVLPWRPAVVNDARLAGGGSRRDRVGFGGLALRDHEVLAPCFQFAFEPDAALEEYARDDGAPLERGRVLVGCVYNALHVGERYAWLQSSACTTAMSRLFERSESVRASWCALAIAAGARAVYLDTEADDWRVLVPTPKLVPRPDVDSFWSEDFEHFDVDAYCRAALEPVE